MNRWLASAARRRRCACGCQMALRSCAAAVGTWRDTMRDTLSLVSKHRLEFDNHINRRHFDLGPRLGADRPRFFRIQELPSRKFPWSVNRLHTRARARGGFMIIYKIAFYMLVAPPHGPEHVVRIIFTHPPMRRLGTKNPKSA